MRSDLIPVPIVDKNGKHTTVHKRAEASTTRKDIPLPSSGFDDFFGGSSGTQRYGRGMDAFQYNLDDWGLPEDEMDTYLIVADELHERYGEPMLGGHRAVWDRGDGYVVKLPHSAAGVHQNEREARESGISNGIPVAECYLDEDEYAVPVLVMEKVDPIDIEDYPGELPSWVNDVDMAQVGYNTEGRLVAYDL